jgi:exocyst complex protein 7
MYGSSRASTSQSTYSGLAGQAGHAVVSAQEQASADLVLLQQNLAKSKRVTTRMTALLTSFDDRLGRLDKSVVPIHRSTRDLSKLQRNVEAALLAIDSVLGTNDLVDREQEIIDRLPDRDGLGVYQASLTRLKAAQESMEKANAAAAAGGASGGFAPGVKGKEKEGTLSRIKDLIETGCDRLGGLFLEAVDNVSPKTGWPDITAWDQGSSLPILMPDDAVTLCKSILAFIRSILGQGSALEQDLQSAYGETRGIFAAATLNSVGREAIEGVEVQTRAGSMATGRMPAFGRRVFGRFLDAMFAMAKVSHACRSGLPARHRVDIFSID